MELFAYLTEMLIYRLNRVTDANVCAFLKLIDGVDRKPSAGNRGMVRMQKNGIACLGEVSLNDEVRRVVLNLRQQDRAVTCEDFERLALAADSRVKRAYCVPRRNLESKTTPYEKAYAHISVVILSSKDDLHETVKRYLEPRRLLTTRIHVVNPKLLSIGVQATLHLKPDAVGEIVRKRVETALTDFFEKERWPFGRSIYVSEIYQLLDSIPGVDFVTKRKDAQDKTVEIVTALYDYKGVRSTQQDNELVAIKLYPDELVQLRFDRDKDITLVFPTEKGGEA